MIYEFSSLLRSSVTQAKMTTVAEELSFCENIATFVKSDILVPLPMPIKWILGAKGLKFLVL